MIQVLSRTIVKATERCNCECCGRLILPGMYLYELELQDTVETKRITACARCIDRVYEWLSLFGKYDNKVDFMTAFFQGWIKMRYPGDAKSWWKGR